MHGVINDMSEEQRKAGMAKLEATSAGKAKRRAADIYVYITCYCMWARLAKRSMSNECTYVMSVCAFLRHLKVKIFAMGGAPRLLIETRQVYEASCFFYKKKVAHKLCFGRLQQEALYLLKSDEFFS